MSAYKIERAESDSGPLRRTIDQGNESSVGEQKQHAISHATCCSHCAGLLRDRGSPMQGRDPPIHVPPPFTRASGPHGDWHIFLLLAVSLRSRFAGSLAALFTVPVTRNGIQVSVGIYSNHVSRDRRSWA